MDMHIRRLVFLVHVCFVYIYVCIYLVNLGLLGIVERPGLLELLVELVNFLLMLLFHTLSLLLKFYQILEPTDNKM